MGTWKEYIEDLKTEFLGKKVTYQGNVYTIADVDYNGVILIDKPARFTPTTAVYMPHEARKALIEEEKRDAIQRSRETKSSI